ncbi:MAG: hypothetical protein ACOZNI_09680 [Myxococcota bacterium]
MRLTREHASWLVTNIPGSHVRPDDLERTYTVHPPIPSAPALPHERRVAIDGDALVWEVFLETDTSVAVSDGWIARRLYAHIPFAGGIGEGAVAHHARLVLAPDFRRRTIGGTICANEERLYRRWGVREIHLHAKQDGPTVWIRLGFAPRDPESLLAEFRRWAARRGHDPHLRDWADLPGEFLRGYSWLPLIKVLH